MILERTAVNCIDNHSKNAQRLAVNYKITNNLLCIVSRLRDITSKLYYPSAQHYCSMYVCADKGTQWDEV